jgi:hypothetical protein
MNRLDVGYFGGTYDSRDIQVAFGAARRADTNSLIGKLKVRRVLISLGIDRHSFDAKLMAGSDDAQCYLTTICYQDSRKHKSIYDLLFTIYYFSSARGLFQVPNSK